MKRVVVILIAAASLGLIGWQVYQKAFSAPETANRRRRGPAVMAVEVEPVVTGSIRDVRDFTGTLEARSQFIVAPKIAGRVKKLLFNIGDKVRQGQLVALLDDEEYRQQVDQARAELEVAKANLEESRDTLEITKKDYERTVVLRQKKIASESELDSAESKYKSQESKVKVALAQVVQKEAALKVAEVRLSYARIEVPTSQSDGYRVVGERYVHEGAMLSANAPIISIFDIRSMIAAIYVIEQDYAKIRVGMEAVAFTDAYPQREFKGRIVRMAPLVKETSREARVEMEIPNPEGLLKPGMFVRVKIQFSQHDKATIVPRDALVKREGKTGLFMVDPQERKAKFVEVAAGISTATKVEILKPALTGQVVTLGQHLLEDGAPVLLPEDAQPAAQSADGVGPPRMKIGKKSENGDQTAAKEAR